MNYHKAETEKDYKYIASLFCKENNEFLIRKEMSWKDVCREHKKDSNVHTFILEVEGENIGWISLTFKPESKKVMFGMIVDKPFQRKGYGTAALDILEKESKQLGAVGLELDVFEKNDPALAIYRKAGFKEVRKMVRMQKDF